MKIGSLLNAAADIPHAAASDEEEELRRYMAEATLRPGARDVATIARLTAALDRIASGHPEHPGRGRRDLTAAECRALAREALGLQPVIEETSSELCHA